MNSLRIMSFNIRYAEPTDGPDVWEFRRPVVANTLKKYLPDVVGMQEPEIEQLRDMEEDLPEYVRFGRSRYGNDFEKFSAVMYRRSTVTLTESGAFWFSETPDEIASSSWLIHKPYAVTWGKFAHIDTGTVFYVYNAQFPYKPEQAEARVQGARIMRERALAHDELTFLTGDFNSDAKGPAYQELVPPFSDAFEDFPDRVGPSATFHGFTGIPTFPARLDWVLYRGDVKVTGYETVEYNEAGRYPSDHYPVFADFTF
jgi:endonuclease/exonuclease/phosphatase family metal-dependent hydrolase